MTAPPELLAGELERTIVALDELLRLEPSCPVEDRLAVAREARKQLKRAQACLRSGVDSTRSWRSRTNQTDDRHGVQIRLPAGPLAVAVQTWARKQGVSWANYVGGTTRAEWLQPGALVLGTSADEWLQRMGLLWFDVWPDDPVARRYFEGA